MSSVLSLLLLLLHTYHYYYYYYIHIIIIIIIIITYSRRVLEVEQGTFTPLVFTSTGGMADECKRFHSRLAELLALKKGDDYATTISWIRAKVSFAILRSALLCLRGTRSKRRAANISDIDITSESAQARI